MKREKKISKEDLINPSLVVEHIDIEKIDVTAYFEACRKMGFTARDMWATAEIYSRMLRDKGCKVFLTIAGSATAAGCMDVPVKMVENNMVDVIVSTGAAIVDMDFFEALGRRHYQLFAKGIDDELLHIWGLDRIYDTIIQEEELQMCDSIISNIAQRLTPRSYSSCEFIYEMGKFLVNETFPLGLKKDTKKNSLVETCYRHKVPIFCPAFTDSSAGFGLAMHQQGRINKGEDYLKIDAASDFRFLTELVIKANQTGGSTGLFMIGGGTPKNFMQDTVVCAEAMGYPVNMHKYAVQITVADVRDGGCSSSTLNEANSWGKVDQDNTQMLYDEATKSWPLIVSQVWRQNKEILASRTRSHYLDHLFPFFIG